MVSMSTCGGSAVARIAPGGLDAVDVRHAHVHQHHVGPRPGDQVDGVAPVGRLADHVDVGLALEDHPEPGAHHRLVVDQHDADRHVAATIGTIGNVARTRQPPPGTRPGDELPGEHPHTLAHPDQPEARRRRGGDAGAATVVDHLDDERAGRRSAP